jgi:hypothetical protein
MKSCFYHIALYKRGISCLLISALLLLALFPFHFHLHHAGDAAPQGPDAYSHTIDMHVYADVSDVEHHGDGHAIEPATYPTLKITALQLPLFIAAFMLLIILLPVTQHVRYCLLSVNSRVTQHYRYNTPPLRAPPRA